MKTATKEKPILFSSPMVQAILAARKTVTRRLVTWKPREPGLNLKFSGLELGYYCTDVPESGWVLRSRGGGGCWNDRTYPAHCPKGKAGDLLWVRESCWLRPERTPHMLREGADTWPSVIYAADQSDVDRQWTKEHGWLRRNSIHMPRRVCRILLEIVDVRIERLQEITDGEIEAEGFTQGQGVWAGSMRAAFSELWNKLNPKEGTRWEDSPWIWRIAFKRVEAEA